MRKVRKCTIPSSARRQPSSCAASSSATATISSRFICCRTNSTAASATPACSARSSWPRRTGARRGSPGPPGTPPPAEGGGGEGPRGAGGGGGRPTAWPGRAGSGTRSSCPATGASPPSSWPEPWPVTRPRDTWHVCDRFGQRRGGEWSGGPSEKLKKWRKKNYLHLAFKSKMICTWRHILFSTVLIISTGFHVICDSQPHRMGMQYWLFNFLIDQEYLAFFMDEWHKYIFYNIRLKLL